MVKLIGILAGVLTSASMLPQFFKLLKTKDSQDISIGMLIVLIAGVAAWVIYGILINDPIIIITNSFSFLVNTVTLIISLSYRKK